MALDHVSIVVSNIEASARFYQAVLGLTVLRTSGDPVTGIWLGSSGVDYLHLNVETGSIAASPKGNHFAFRTDAFDDTVERLRQLEIPFSDWPGSTDLVGKHPMGFRQIYVTDPDGHWLEINDVQR